VLICEEVGAEERVVQEGLEDGVEETGLPEVDEAAPSLTWDGWRVVC